MLVDAATAHLVRKPEQLDVTRPNSCRDILSDLASEYPQLGACRFDDGQRLPTAAGAAWIWQLTLAGLDKVNWTLMILSGHAHPLDGRASSQARSGFMAKAMETAVDKVLEHRHYGLLIWVAVRAARFLENMSQRQS